MTRSPTSQSLLTRPRSERLPWATLHSDNFPTNVSDIAVPKLEPDQELCRRAPIHLVQMSLAVAQRTTVSTFSARTLDHDGEVQASLVVGQLERRRPHAFAHSRRVAALSVRVARLAHPPGAEVPPILLGA